MYPMKATLDLPDDLYRRVKARSAMEGRPVRSVAVELFQKWLDSPDASVLESHPVPTPESAPWLKITKRYIKPGMSHDMEAIRAAIGKGWSAGAEEKLEPPPSFK